MKILQIVFGRTRVQNVLRTFGRNLEDAFVPLGSTPPETNFSRNREVSQVAVKSRNEPGREIPSERSNHH